MPPFTDMPWLGRSEEIPLRITWRDISVMGASETYDFNQIVVYFACDLKKTVTVYME